MKTIKGIYLGIWYRSQHPVFSGGIQPSVVVRCRISSQSQTFRLSNPTNDGTELTTVHYRCSQHRNSKKKRRRKTKQKQASINRGQRIRRWRREQQGWQQQQQGRRREWLESPPSSQRFPEPGRQRVSQQQLSYC